MGVFGFAKKMAGLGAKAAALPLRAPGVKQATSKIMSKSPGMKSMPERLGLKKKKPIGPTGMQQ